MSDKVENINENEELGIETAPHIEKYMENQEKLEKINETVGDVSDLSLAEQKFLDLYMIYADVPRAMKEAGIETSSPTRKFNALKKKPAFAKALNERRKAMQTDSIMSAQEVMEYLTAVVRGEVKDQFGLDAPLSERTKAALEIAKRTIDIELKEKEKQNNQDKELTIKVDWER